MLHCFSIAKRCGFRARHLAKEAGQPWLMASSLPPTFFDLHCRRYADFLWKAGRRAVGDSRARERSLGIYSRRQLFLPRGEVLFWEWGSFLRPNKNAIDSQLSVSCCFVFMHLQHVSHLTGTSAGGCKSGILYLFLDSGNQACRHPDHIENHETPSPALYRHAVRRWTRRRVVLKALHRRYLRLEESFHLVSEDMKAAKAPPAVEARPLLLEICRAVRWGPPRESAKLSTCPKTCSAILLESVFPRHDAPR